VVRLPSIEFGGTSREAEERLHARLWLDLSSGRVDLARERWPLRRRVAGWAIDFARVGWSKGPSFARTWVARRRLRAGR
jgi:hypothetical protein